jgi:formate dehydrogenase subunit gamma
MERTSAGGEPAAAPAAPSLAARSKILRFARSERLLHWCIAGPFLLSFATAAVLVAIYNPDPSRPFRSFFSELHRVSGIALIVLPMLAAYQARRDVRLHFYNIKQAWIWMFDDFKWLALMGLAAISDKVKLPEQGKFNAAEKLNFMVLMVTYPLYVLTGLLMWLTHLAILSWILHFLMAVLAMPLVGGHMYMALINPGSRKGLHGMISGFVDRQWAKHHYRRWYREHHEATEVQPAGETGGELWPPIVPAHESESLIELARTLRPAAGPPDGLRVADSRSHPRQYRQAQRSEISTAASDKPYAPCESASSSSGTPAATA